MSSSVVDAPIQLDTGYCGMAPHVEMSQAFRELATILETLETTETDLEMTSVRPINDDVLGTQTIALDVYLEIPFLGSSLSETATVSPEAVALEDGQLIVELQVIAEGPQATAAPESDAPDHTYDGGEPESKPNATGTVVDDEQRSDRTGNTGSKTQSATVTDDTETSDQAEEPAGEETDAGGDEPAYRDPERLREVYNTHDTFSEMTDALDVDVTAQTVRRYMIENEIHKPASRTGSQSAETLLETDPDSLPTPTAEQSQDTSKTIQSVESPLDVKPRSSAAPDEESQTHSTTKDNETACSDGPFVDRDSHRSPSNEHSSEDNRSDESNQYAPDTASIATDGGAQTPSKNNTPSIDPSVTGLDDQAIAEAVGLPSHLTLDELKVVVRDAKTLYEAHQQLGLNRERTRSLLQQLNLLDLVHGRLATRDRYTRTIAEINRRIQTASL